MPADDEIGILLGMLASEEWLQGRLEGVDAPLDVSGLTAAHVELYAMLCAAEGQRGASQAALRLAWIQGAGAMLAMIRERCR